MKLFIVLILSLFVSSATNAQVVESNAPATGNGVAPQVAPSPDGANKKVSLVPEKAAPVRVGRMSSAPLIDGKLDDEVWREAAVFDNFYQTNPGDNTAPSRPTVARIGYDAKNLYLSFYCYDEPDKIRATIAARDGVFGEDNVRVFLDTFNDRRRAYVIGFNPLGIQQDGILTSNGNTDFSVDLVMESKGQIVADGWTLEAAIPFKSLRYEIGKNKLWGIHIWRNIDRFNDEIDSWMPLSRDIVGILNQTGHITGLDGIDVERTIELIPSLKISESGARIATADTNTDATGAAITRFANRPVTNEFGLTGKLVLNPTMTLDFTYNPDFADVEADQTVVTANQRFPIFFPEKRPFFLEGKEIFETPLQALNTRTIGDPDFAAKLSGKRGKNTYGFLFATDNAPNGVKPANNNNSLIGVARVKRDIGTEDNLGLIATTFNLNADETRPLRYNHTLGFDGLFRVNPTTIFSFQALGTRARRIFYNPDNNANEYRIGNGLGYQITYDVTGRNNGFIYSGQGRSRDYRADLGFTRRVNTNNHFIGWRHSNNPDAKRALIGYRLTQNLGTNFDWQGRLQQWNTSANLSLNLHRQTYINVGGGFGYERLFEFEFGARRNANQAGAFFGNDAERSTYRQSVSVSYDTRPSQKYGYGVSYGYTRGAFDFDFGAGQNFPRVSPAAIVLGQDVTLDPGAGNQTDAEIYAEWQPVPQFNLTQELDYSSLTRHDTRLTAFRTYISSTRATYQFTRFIFLRLRADYETLSANLRGQILLGWTPRPGTALYVGYNDDLRYNGFSNFTGQYEPGFQRNGRTFFIKLSYLFRRSI